MHTKKPPHHRVPLSTFRRNAARARATVRAAAGRHPQIAAYKRRRRRSRTVRGTVLAFCLIALLLSLFRCSCDVPPSPASEPDPNPTGTPRAGSGPQVTVRHGTQVSRIDRSRFSVPESEEYPWFEVFRQQVVARSPRLSACFEHSVRPGGVRWSATLQPTNGLVFDHGIEEVGSAVSISETQRACLIGVLGNPAYSPMVEHDDRVANKDTPSKAVRVSLVLEF